MHWPILSCIPSPISQQRQHYLVFLSNAVCGVLSRPSLITFCFVLFLMLCFAKIPRYALSSSSLGVRRLAPCMAVHCLSTSTLALLVVGPFADWIFVGPACKCCFGRCWRLFSQYARTPVCSARRGGAGEGARAGARARAVGALQRPLAPARQDGALWHDELGGGGRSVK